MRFVLQDRTPTLWTSNFLLITLGNAFFFCSLFFQTAALPLYLNQLGAGEFQIGLVIGLGSGVAIAARLFAGTAVDRLGQRKRFLLFGTLLFAIASLLMIPAAQVGHFFVLRFLQGIAIAGFTTAAGTLAADIAPGPRRAEAMGYFGMSGNVAMAIGPALAGFLVLTTGFDGVFAVATVLCALALLTVWRIHEPRREPTAAASTGGLIAINRSAVFPALVLVTMTFGFGGIISFAPLRAGQVGLGNVGLFFTLMAGTMIAIRLTTGRLADRFGRSAVIIPSALFAAAASLILATTASSFYLLVAAVLFGIGVGAVVPALTALVIDRVAATERGSAMATFFAAFDVGVGLGAILIGYLIESVSFSFAFGIATAAALIGAALVWRDGQRPEKVSPDTQTQAHPEHQPEYETRPPQAAPGPSARR